MKRNIFLILSLIFSINCLGVENLGRSERFLGSDFSQLDNQGLQPDDSDLLFDDQPPIQQPDQTQSLLFVTLKKPGSPEGADLDSFILSAKPKEESEESAMVTFGASSLVFNKNLLRKLESPRLEMFFSLHYDVATLTLKGFGLKEETFRLILRILENCYDAEGNIIEDKVKDFLSSPAILLYERPAKVLAALEDFGCSSSLIRVVRECRIQEMERNLRELERRVQEERDRERRMRRRTLLKNGLGILAGCTMIGFGIWRWSKN